MRFSVFFIVLLLCCQLNAQPEITLSTTVTGNQEQPKVIYIIPWQAPVGTEALQIRLGASFMEENFEHLSPPEMQRQLAFKDQIREGLNEQERTD